MSLFEIDENKIFNKKNQNILLTISLIANFMNPFMGSAVNVALKNIGSDFEMSAVGLSWVNMSYLLASAVFLVPFGRLGDTWGRTKTFFYGNIFFAITTILCGLAIDSGMFITMRFFQGIAAALMTSSSMALVISAFPPEERGRVIGINVSAVYVGLSLAPFIGGILTDFLTWRSLFIINSIFSVILSVMIFWQLRYEWSKPVNEKFDLLGTIIYVVSFSLLMYGISKLPNTNAIIMTILGVFGLAYFIYFELKTQHPVLDIRLFTHNKVFTFANISALINYAATFAVAFMLSLYLQFIKGMSAKETGLILIAQPIMMALTSTFSGKLSDKIHPRIIATIGMAISSIGLSFLIFLNFDTSILFIIIGLIVLGLGFGTFSSPNTNIAMSAVDKKTYGIASATLATMRNTGMMFSMAIAAFILHLNLGYAEISTQTGALFINSNKTVFIIFTALCVFGVFTSWVKKNS